MPKAKHKQHKIAVSCCYLSAKNENMRGEKIAHWFRTSKGNDRKDRNFRCGYGISIHNLRLHCR